MGFIILYINNLGKGENFMSLRIQRTQAGFSSASAASNAIKKAKPYAHSNPAVEMYTLDDYRSPKDIFKNISSLAKKFVAWLKSD